MEYKTEEGKVMHETELRRQELIWEKCYDHLLLSDRAAIDTGLGALKTSVLINAGALVALITFIAQVWTDKNSKSLAILLFHTSIYFTAGLVSASISFAIAYFYQGSVTNAYSHLVEKMPVSNEPFPRALVRNQNLFRIPMIISGVLSIVAFAVGSYETLSVFSTAK